MNYENVTFIEYQWKDGVTSWSVEDKRHVTFWKYAKLYEKEDVGE